MGGASGAATSGGKMGDKIIVIYEKKNLILCAQ